MNIEPADSLYSVSQPFALRGELHQSLTVGLGFDLLTRRVIPAARAMGAAMQALSPGECLDMGLPKREAEWLMAASAFTPQGKALTSLVARVRVGKTERRFLITGKADASGKPQTFTSMPMSWNETFGAPGHPENPLGCGLAPDAQTGRARPPRLVGVEDPHGRPACPGAMGAWPARMRNMGSHDAHWRQTRCPDLPDDCDLSYLNLAQRAQRLPELKGDEAVFLSGVHAEHPEIQTRLPGKTVRVHVRREGKAEEVSILPYDTLWLFPNQLVGLLLGHLLLPCSDSAGSDIGAVRFEVTPPDPVEAAPPPDAPEATATPPKMVETAASAPETETLAAGAAAASALALAAAPPGAKSDAPPPAEAAPSPPAEAAPSPPAALFSAEDAARMQTDAIGEFHESLPEINAALVEAGLPPMTPEQIRETEAQIVAQTTRTRELAQKMEAAPEPNLEDTLRQAGIPEETIQGVNAVLEMPPPDPADYGDGLSWRAAVDRYLSEFERHLPLSESARAGQRQSMLLMGPDGDAELEKMAGPMPTLVEALTRAGLAPEQAALLAGELEHVPSFDSLTETKAYLSGLEGRVGFAPGSMTRVVESMENAAAKMGVTLDAPAVATPDPADTADEDAAATAGRLAAAAAGPMAGKAALDAVKGAGEKAADAPPPSPPPPAGGETLHYAYQDLSGRDFSGKNLDGADFTRATLKGANFAGASLRSADFDHADCTRANFTKATLDNASFRESRCRSACFTEASAQGARFVETDLSGAEASGLGANRAELDGATLMEANVGKAVFQGALIKNLSAAGLKAEGADFSGANCMDCDFSGADFSGANWKAALISGTRLDRAGFRAADLGEATLLGGTRLAEADFRGAALKGGDWRAVDARRSRFDACDAGGANFIGCSLGGSRWELAKAQGADFSRSDLSGADFSGSNLMRAALRESRVAGTDFSAANLYGADLYRADMTLAETRDALLGNTLLSARRETKA